MYLFTIKLDGFVLDVVAEDAESALLHIHKRFNVVEEPVILRTDFIEDPEEEIEHISKAVNLDE